jgi:GTPase
MEPAVTFRSGLVPVVGRPNVGKSSLVNALVGSKVSIVSDKPQTTRIPVRGVVNGEGFQVVFTDTPGFHKPRTALGELLNRRVDESVTGVDAVLLVVDGAAGIGRGDAFVARREVAPFTGPKLCAVNKIDLLRPPGVVQQLAAAADLAEFDHLVPVSARTGRGLEELRGAIASSLPESVPLYPEGKATDQPVEFTVSETIREKALALTRDEIPHSIAVVVDELSRKETAGVVSIAATVFVERESQKGIVVGKGGSMLKEIGTRARQELEQSLGSRVYLDLRVKVKREWQRDPAALTRLGL